MSGKRGAAFRRGERETTMTEVESKLMCEAIAWAERCQPIDPDRIPKVGAIIAVGDVVIGRGYLGTGKPKDDEHAELNALEQVADRSRLPKATVYTTLEPCTGIVRSRPNYCCTELIKRAEVKRVYIGILDPNQGVCGKGVLALQSSGIEVELFPPNLAKSIRILNERFILAQQTLGIRITKPQQGEQLRTYETNGAWEIRGDCLNAPREDVFVFTNKGGEWWPHFHPLRMIGERTWSTTINFGTHGPHAIYVVKASELGINLVKYYRKVCRLNLDRKEQLRGNLKAQGKEEEEKFLRKLRGDYPGIEMSRLPKGFEFQDMVEVEVVKNPEQGK
jgi:pyrimidine deaminase RibD-like protein